MINRMSKIIDLFHFFSSFKQGDSYINHLLSITHDIYQFLDQGYEVRGVVLDISKAFDKV